MKFSYLQNRNKNKIMEISLAKGEASVREIFKELLKWKEEIL